MAHSAHSPRPFDGLVRDVRTALRQLRRHPGLWLATVGTLALGLAVSAAVFTYIDAYDRPFPGTSAEGVSQVSLSTPDEPYRPVSFPDYLDLTEAIGNRFDVAGVRLSPFAASVRHEDLTEVAFGEAVTGGFFELLGVDLAEGRGLRPEDDRPGAEPAVVISHAYWVERYASDPGAVGRSILLNNEPYTIVGVAGRTFLGSSSAARPQFWLPFEQYMRVYWARSDNRADRELAALTPLVRADDGEAGIASVLTALAQGLDERAPLAQRSRSFHTQPATWISPATREQEAATARILRWAAVAILLLACVNMASLVLTTGARRRWEMTLRTALGARRTRLIRQLLVESLFVSLPAGLLALALATPLAARLGSYFSRPSVWGANVPRLVGVDLGVIGFALGLAVLCGLLANILPAMRITDGAPATALSAGATGAPLPAPTGARARLGTDALVSLQVAISVGLVLVAGLTLKTLQEAARVDPGFATDRTLASYVSTSSMGTPVDERHRFFRELIERFELLPWVEAATVADNAPLSPHANSEVRIEEAPAPVPVTVARVWPGYFEALDIDVLQGRPLLPTDTAAAAGVVVVNQALAERIRPGGSAVGSRLYLPGAEGEPEREFTVAGVVGDLRLTELLERPGPAALFSLPQHYSSPGNALLVRVRGPTGPAVERMEQELRSVDSRIAIVNILPYRDVTRGFLYTQRMNAEMFSVTAALGLLLSAAGLFGVVAMGLARRRRELGVRVALGADRSALVGLVVRSLARPLVAGVLLGGLGALWGARLLEEVLLGVHPADPLVIALGAAVLMAAVGLAVGLPIRRALRIDPVESLRAD